MFTQVSMEIYVDPGNSIITILINNFLIPNTLIDLGAYINVMTMEIFPQLLLCNLLPTPIVLDLVDQSKIILEGVLEYIIVPVNTFI